MYDPAHGGVQGEIVVARRVRVILQARTSSSRLPAKVLLPIAGLPLAILCARRLGTAGQEVVLATSCDRTDDMLASLAQKGGLRVFRGSLGDVLDRFVQCSGDLSESDLVVRATADNPLPNGAFVENLLQTFDTRNVNYLATLWPAQGLPYGVCVEVMTVGGLRRAAEMTDDPFDREHVTPWLARQAPAPTAAPVPLLRNDHSHLRATIDTLQDYLAIASVFADVKDPVGIDWWDLVSKLARDDNTRARLSHITLGTAQLGLNYGVANQTGKPSDAEVGAILSAAIRSGVACLDTARAYGDSESRIGRFLSRDAGQVVKIISKLKPLDSIPDDASTREIRSAVDASIYGSCRDLRRERLDVLLFHRSDDMFRWRRAAVDRMEELVDDGVIGAIGTSVYSPDEAVKSLAETRITHLQIPFNLLDLRWLDRPFLDALDSRVGLQVHVRSVFLQGLLINTAAAWPTWATQSRVLVQRIDELVRELGRKSAADLCMAYVRSFAWVSSLVLGVETARQWEELCSYAAEPALTAQQALIVQASLSNVPVRLLNPSLW
jgi:spore coat polysaccharide biosynthesis protein SpsF (cytidylyltransferase family)/aryl-alcohol dehydrogenase-like predicted oxidoreductase